MTDRQTDRHFIIIYISSSLTSAASKFASLALRPGWPRRALGKIFWVTMTFSSLGVPTMSICPRKRGVISVTEILCSTASQSEVHYDAVSRKRAALPSPAFEFTARDGPSSSSSLSFSLVQGFFSGPSHYNPTSQSGMQETALFLGC